MCDSGRSREWPACLRSATVIPVHAHALRRTTVFSFMPDVYRDLAAGWMTYRRGNIVPIVRLRRNIHVRSQVYYGLAWTTRRDLEQASFFDWPSDLYPHRLLL